MKVEETCTLSCLMCSDMEHVYVSGPYLELYTIAVLTKKLRKTHYTELTTLNLSFWCGRFSVVEEQKWIRIKVGLVDFFLFLIHNNVAPLTL